MLIVAYNYEVWQEMAVRKEQGEPKVRVEDSASVHKFFKKGRGRGCSWSVEGRLYYNDMSDKTVEDINIIGDSFDQSFLSKMQEEESASNSQQRDKGKTKARLGVEVVKCRNNFDQQMLTIDDVMAIEHV
jgi:hypothetical protein